MGGANLDQTTMSGRPDQTTSERVRDLEIASRDTPGLNNDNREQETITKTIIKLEQMLVCDVVPVLVPVRVLVLVRILVPVSVPVPG